LVPGRLELSAGVGRYRRSASDTAVDETATIQYLPFTARLGLIDGLALQAHATAVQIKTHKGGGDHVHDDGGLHPHATSEDQSNSGLGAINVALSAEARPGEGEDGPFRLVFDAGVSLPVGQVDNPVSGDQNFSSGSVDALTGVEAAYRVTDWGETHVGADVRTVLAQPDDGMDLRTGSSVRGEIGLRTAWLSGSLGLGASLSHVRRTPDDKGGGSVSNSGGDWTYLGTFASWRFSGALAGTAAWVGGLVPLRQDTRSAGDEFQVEDDYMVVAGLSWSAELWEHEHEDEDEHEHEHAEAPHQASEAPGPASAPTSQPVGKVVTISTDGRDLEISDHAVPGKWTVVDISAPWCEPCKELLRRLTALAAARSDLVIRRFEFETWDQALPKRWVPKGQLPFVQVYDPHGKLAAQGEGSIDACMQTVEGVIP
jgi:thiol-disulfide isomerase/thioredoxin